MTDLVSLPPATPLNICFHRAQSAGREWCAVSLKVCELERSGLANCINLCLCHSLALLTMSLGFRSTLIIVLALPAIKSKLTKTSYKRR